MYLLPTTAPVAASSEEGYLRTQILLSRGIHFIRITNHYLEKGIEYLE